MISMSQVVTIRQLRKSGESIASISRITGVSRDTVYKYLALDDLSPKMPVKRPGSSMMDQYRSVIEGWLDGDARSWRKQRHAAARIHARLRDECGCEASESTARHHVARLKAERRESKEAFLDLVWAPARLRPTSAKPISTSAACEGGCRTSSSPSLTRTSAWRRCSPVRTPSASARACATYSSTAAASQRA